MTKWAFFDTSWMAYRAHYSFKELSHEDIATSVLFGLFEQIRTICADHRVNTTAIGFCFDSNESYRREVLPSYKSKRRENKTPEEVEQLRTVADQIKRLRREILPDIGFKTFLQYGLESDDLMAQGALQTATGCVLITADTDLYQCIDHHVHWYNPAKDLYLDLAGLLEETRCRPNDWATVKCIAGCSTDNVPGVPGVGVVTATDYLWHLVPKHHKRYLAIESPEGQDRIKENAALICLPHAKTKPLDLSFPSYDADKFFDWCKRLGFSTYTSGPKRTWWEKFFEGSASSGVQKARKRNTE